MLSQEQFLSFITPTVESTFGEGSLSSENIQEFSEEIRSFIEDPKIIYLIVRKSENILIQTSFEYTDGPIVICQKFPVQLESANFQSFVSIISLPANRALEFLQYLVSQIFMPYVRSAITTKEKSSQSVIEKLAGFDVSLTRYIQRCNLPEPSFDAKSSIADAAANGTLTKAQESVFFSDIAQWEKSIKSIISYATMPPSFDRLHEELSFWALLGQRITQGYEQAEAIFNKTGLVNAITKRHVNFKSFFDEAFKDLGVYSKSISEFAIALNGLDSNIDELEGCETVEEMKQIISKVYSFLSSFFKQSKYQERSPDIYKLTKACIIDKMISIIATMSLPNLPLDTFRSEIKSINELLDKWVSDEKTFINFLTEFKISCDQIIDQEIEKTEIYKRIHQLEGIKIDYHTLSSHLREHQELDADYVITSLDQAFNLVLSAPFLEFTQSASKRWDASVDEFNSRMKKIDLDFIHIITKLLKKNSSLNHIQDVFVTHRVICSREAVLHSLKDTQQKFVDEVEKQLTIFSNNQLTEIDKLPIIQYLIDKGTSDVIAKYHHVQHISHKLDSINEMMCNVIGERWLDDYQVLREIYQTCRRKVDQGSNIKKISESFKNIKDILDQSIFIVTNKDNTLILSSSFKEVKAKSISIFRSLQQMDKIEDINLILDFNTLNRAYKNSVRIQEGIDMFNTINANIDNDLRYICADDIEQIYKLIREGYNYKWNNPYVKDFSKDFATQCLSFAKYAKRAKTHINKINECIELIENGTANDNITQAMETIQSEVDSLFFGRSSNITQYISDINNRIITAIASKMEEITDNWTTALQENKEIPNTEPVVINVTVRRSMVSITPKAEEIQQLMINKYSDQINTYLLQNTICYDKEESILYRDTEPPFPVPHRELFVINELISKACDNINEYLSAWNKLKALFILKPDQVKFSEELPDWIDLIKELQQEREDILQSNETETVACFTINTRNARKAAINRIDDWIRYSKGKIQTLAQQKINEFINQIDDSSSKIKQQIPKIAKELAEFLRNFKEGNDRQVNWESYIPTFEEAEKYCKVKELPSFKTGIERFKDIIEEKREVIDKNKASLRTQVKTESDTMTIRIENIKKKWNQEKPLNGDIQPEKALSILQSYVTIFNQVKIEWDQVCSAMDLLGVEYGEEVALSMMQEERDSMVEVWTLLKETWSKISVHFQKRFTEITPQSFRSLLNSMIEELQGMSNVVRQYDGWSYLMKKLKNILKTFPIIEGLKSQAIQPRHWQQISREFGIQINVEELTLQDIFDLNLETNEHFFSDIIRNAQGEFSLHQYLEQLDQTWGTLEFEFGLYKDRINLIKSGPVVLATISDHLNFLGTMQTSPFFHVFRDQATNWENSLNRLQVILDDWLDVQRRFIYLEGVFNSSDIRSILVKATSNFRKAEKEFSTITKRAVQLRLVMKITTIPNIGTILQTLNDSLLSLQKELSDYLEKQRSLFPRFFFIGDEDLLEIIGKSSAINEIQRHFGKMFEGLSAVECENDAVVSMGCNEGEVVKFEKPVPITPAVHQTLSNLEKEMRNSLKKLVLYAIVEFEAFWENMTVDGLKDIINRNSAQVVLLCFFIVSTAVTEKGITKKQVPESIAEIVKFIQILSQIVFTNLTPAARHCVQQLITEAVHQRNISKELLSIESIKAFEWTRFLRFYLNRVNGDLTANIGDASFLYGFEYLGLCPSLVRTPLTDRVYLTMAQALFAKLGGSPFGPAGTGKTETVKNMGHHLGRLVLVFNCDETFDFKAMGRIFVGLCHCGSWGCFDEFNRLDEQMLSAVSQQIQTIQVGLKSNIPSIQILGRKVPLNHNIGIFITMNPGYAGRVELPDNLKQLFRTMAMNKPDTDLITEVLLFSQGFASAEYLAPKFVLLFSMAKESLSNQTHYDFGLRAMKSVLTNAGQLIRANPIADDENRTTNEAKLLISSIVNALFPKLLAPDLIKLKRLMDDIFPGITPQSITETELLNTLKEEAAQSGWIDSEIWVQKIVQLYYIQQINHGFMLVGSSATGKTSAWKTLLKVLTKLDKQESESYVINPKSVTKDTLFGCLDPVTREWTDGVFTRILRTIVGNQKGEMQKRHWIVFDGDVDPEWVENLNSVLDDNKLLTLPNGERIALPPNVRIVFEVENLNFATPATVSRCGIVYFSKNTLDTEEIVHYHLHRLSTEPIITPTHILFNDYMEMSIPEMLELQKQFVEGVKDTLTELIEECISFWSLHQEKAVMDIPIASSISTLFALMAASFVNCYQMSEPETYLQKAALFSTFWAFASAFPSDCRSELATRLCSAFPQIAPEGSLLLFTISPEAEDWISVEEGDQQIDVETGFVQTPETQIARDLIQMMTVGGKTAVLCGYNGVGKQSTLKDSLSKYTDLQTINLDFSNCSTIDFALQVLEHFCVYRKTSTGVKIVPKAANTYLTFICNNINLPTLDKYGTQRVVEFLRQFLDLNGFWHPYRREWITLEYISFTGLCSPPTCHGRVKLNSRFLRHTSIIYIEHPPIASVKKIVQQTIREDSFAFEEESTNAMVDFYFEFRDHFRGSENVHYLANMRDLIEWISSLKFALKSGSSNVAHVLFYEGCRIFGDRLTEMNERKWVQDSIQEHVLKEFSEADLSPFQDPLCYSRIIGGKYQPYEYKALATPLANKMKEFSEENATDSLVFFDECIDIVCRVERRLAKPSGHLFMVGLSGTGKTLIPQFVSYLLDMPFIRLQVYKGYGISEFDADLRKILKEALERPICFHIKESDLISPVFTERLNVLLAESNIPGLYTGDEYASLISAIKDTVRVDGVRADSDEDLMNYFTEKVHNNLHVVFTANSATIDMNERDIFFPSLFATATVIWIGTWSEESLKEFAAHVIKENELEDMKYTATTMVDMHRAACESSTNLPVTNYVSPRYFFDFAVQFCNILKEKRQKLQTEQLHLNTGLSKLEETQFEVSKMGKDLEIKQKELKEKEALAEQKLAEIVKDTQVTTTKKNEAQRIKSEIEVKRVSMKDDKEKAEKELAQVAPAIEEAKSSVSNISKQKLDEIRRLSSPPEVIKNTLQAVLMLLGMGTGNWAAIRRAISGESFIRTVLEFDIDTVKLGEVKKVSSFINASDLTLEKANRASQACGPLFKWLNANLRYLKIMESTAPLREKVEKIEKEAAVLEVKYKDLEKTVVVLERKLSNLTNEYKGLVAQCEQTRIEAEAVKVKMERASHLLSSLSSETKRWKESRSNFQRQSDNIVGHSLLSAAFVAYCGFLEQQRRIDSVFGWREELSKASIKFSDEYDFTSFMTDPQQIIEWSNKSLPKDDLCIQNAVILNQQTKRVPLIIDPAGQATAFLTNSYSNIVRTSFIDPKFPKHLESCLRFGSPLLVEEGEQMDPLVYPVLAREFKKISGRTLLDLKHNDIDVSPAFQMFIVTRDTDYAPPPFIASMTVLVNFSVTSLSLRAQCLTRLLQFKLPDIEKQRQELHTSLSSMQVSLHSLEDNMLNVFSTTKGEILENDELLHLLEHIKEESREIEKKAAETRAALNKITQVSEQFSPVAEVSTSLYFVLKGMSSVHYLYQFSLQFFWSVFDKTSAADAKPDDLIEMIARDLFVATSYSLLNKHLSILGFRFGQIIIAHRGIKVDDSLYDLALRGTSLGAGHQPEWLKIGKTEEGKKWLKNDSPESEISPEVLKVLTGGVEEHRAITALKVLALMRKFRQDRILPSVKQFVTSCFGDDITDTPPLDLMQTASDTHPQTPILLCASAGYDPSYRVESSALRPLESVAVGSSDSQAAIEATVKSAAQRGNWVIIKNVHLAPMWTRDFVKSLQQIKAHRDFRIFMTSEINPKVGSNVFRACRVIVFESATGIRANLKRIYSSGLTWPNIPQERRQIALNFIWMHAVVIERLRFAPLGWSKQYEFNDSDLRFGMQIGLRWLEDAAAGRSHLSAEQFPWTAIRFLLSGCVYGGRVDQSCDQRVLRAMSELMFKPNATIGDGILQTPELSSMDDFKQWADKLPENESPELLWLPKNSGKFLFIQQGNETLQHIISVIAGSASGHSDDRRTSFVQLLLKQWREKISSVKLPEAKVDQSNLIACVIADEMRSITTTRNIILSDSAEIIDSLEAGFALTQKDQSIIADIAGGRIPNSWNPHGFFCSDLNTWIDNFVDRLRAISSYIQSGDACRSNIDLSLLRSPESLLAAARQTAASAKGWDIENVKMSFDVGATEISTPFDIIACGITTLNAVWDKENKCLSHTDDVTGVLPKSRITFTLEEKDEGIIVSCFTTSSKKRSVFECNMNVSNDKDRLWWSVRNPSLVLQTNAI